MSTQKAYELLEERAGSQASLLGGFGALLGRLQHLIEYAKASGVVNKEIFMA